MADLVTIKVTEDSRVMLRLLAAYSGGEMADTLAQVLREEIDRKKISLPRVIAGLRAKSKGSNHARPKRGR